RGSGLGLSVVHSVVEDHKGFIDFDTKTGSGTTFYLYFPVCREAIEVPPADSDIPCGAENILVVDDDWTQRDVTVMLLGKLGYHAISVECGEDAVKSVKDCPVDLLILDMIMPPGIDGTETYRRILETVPNQKAIVISGYAESERVKEALNMGAGAFVRKPITLETLARAVRDELDRVVADR
ncbi:MAG: response regulator, partial [candidate division Zixibacteria bacterium]|nr:response regulator [candidate division Zixibacteria bacterium]